ncbi:MAG: hypothetical protein GX138_08570 [Firmicutes bacterium]|nr:hypothetical protein [Bacillota bacterium]
MKVNKNKRSKSAKESALNSNKQNYALSRSMVSLTSLLKLFLTKGSTDHPFGQINEQWFIDRTIDFAKSLGYSERQNESLFAPFNFLEERYALEQNTLYNSIMAAIQQNNLDFSELSRQPNLLGLFFSILDQFSDFKNSDVATIRFNSEIEQEPQNFYRSNANRGLSRLCMSPICIGDNVFSKALFGFTNWLIYFVSVGASGEEVWGKDIHSTINSRSQGASSPTNAWGKDIPLPIKKWANGVSSLIDEYQVPPAELTEKLNQLVLKIYQRKYEDYFQFQNAIPVYVNDINIMLIYAINRACKDLATKEWNDDTPTIQIDEAAVFNSPEVKRMLTVAHTAFLTTDLINVRKKAKEQGEKVVPFDLMFQINVISLGRFGFALYEEGSQLVNKIGSLATAPFRKASKNKTSRRK